MPTSAAKPAKLAAMTRAEVIAYLGKSKRTVAQYVADGRLPQYYVSGPNGSESRYDRADVERMKKEIDTPIRREVEKPVALARTGAGALERPTPIDAAKSLAPLAEAIAASLRTALQPSAAPVPMLTPHMTLAEAVEYSGLPAAFLVAGARAGTIRAVNVGRGKKEFWRFAREGALAK